MIYLRFEINGEEKYGISENRQTVVEIKPDYFSDFKKTKTIYDISNVKLLAPCKPSKIIALGLSYEDHAKELNMPISKFPVIFMKPSTSVIGTNENIVYPSLSKRVDFEGELAVAIKKKAKNISETDASSFILGFTCFNDVTARDLQEKDGQWTRAKSFDTFSPVGPWIVDKIDPDNLKIKTLVNGQLKQNSNTKNLIISIKKIVSYVSSVMTLLPGDIITTGTPPGIGPLSRGDKVSIEIENIGNLTNTVI
ncbi:fumarylacetoacetate hydrolase family protein [Elusimicrobiota bacterium]